MYFYVSNDDAKDEYYDDYDYSDHLYDDDDHNDDNDYNEDLDDYDDHIDNIVDLDWKCYTFLKMLIIVLMK